MASSSPAKKSIFTLTASSPLNGFSIIINGASLIEITTLSMVSISCFASDEKGFQTAILELFDSGPPSPTAAYENLRNKACFFLPSAHDQWFLCFNNDGADPVDSASGLLGRKISNQLTITDQSDSWVVLALTGPLVRGTLERICPINCSASAMPVGTTARTVIQHLGAIIVRRPDDSDDNPCFWLLSARSSASSFLHAISASPPFST